MRELTVQHKFSHFHIASTRTSISAYNLCLFYVSNNWFQIGFRFKIQVKGRMTDQCLKQVNQHYVTQVEPNKIQVPYTNGVSKTFEDTLIAALIVLRDVSPTLSIWEAFELRTLVSHFNHSTTRMERKECSGLTNVDSR